MWNSKKVWHSSGTMKQYGGNSVEQYGGTLEQCKIMWWNSRTV